MKISLYLILQSQTPDATSLYVQLSLYCIISSVSVENSQTVEGNQSNPLTILFLFENFRLQGWPGRAQGLGVASLGV